MATAAEDLAIRLACFRFLEEQTRLHGETLKYSLLQQGFEHGGQCIRLIGPQGIFKPAALSFPLSVTTAPPSPRKQRPYDDQLGDNGIIRYKYRGTNPIHADNVGLRETMRLRLPLVYFYGIVEGVYMPVWPVFVVGDEPEHLTFLVQVEDAASLPAPDHYSLLVLPKNPKETGKRDYITVLTKRRLHQAGFRIRVLEAYRRHCAICRLRHEELLDAAHIVPDSAGGQPVVRNGVALCKLHHAAFDHNVIGIRPDFSLEVRGSVLDEEDGPMLRHGLQEVHNSQLLLPRRRELRPDPEWVAWRYDKFLAAR